MKNLYYENGYVNMGHIINMGYPFTFVIGGRGTGKTWGALDHVLTTGTRFMLMRRTQSQIDLINKPEFNPFKAVDDSVWVKPISKYHAGFYRGDDELLGYTCALSTVANIRGFSAEDVKLLVFDEFIHEKHERELKFEGQAFLNAYETLNRNRELKGEKPLQVLCLANANDIANPIFREMGLISKMEKLLNKGRSIYKDKSRGVLIIRLQGSMISAWKKDTALYRATAEGSFTEMALDNAFAYDDMSGIRSMPLNEYRPICAVGDMAVYKHKSDNTYYVSAHISGDPDTFSSDEIGIKKYRKRYGPLLHTAYMRDRVVCESMVVKSLFELYTI